MNSDLAVVGLDRKAAWAIIEGNVARAVKMIEACCDGSDPAKVYVTPEFAFQGAPHTTPVAEWIEKACCSVPGPITEPLQALAAKRKIYIGGNQFETSEEWPGRYFNTCFLIAPTGEVILRYRRINTAMFPSPHDFMTAYTHRYTPRETFPVVGTELGRIGMIACGEILVPEVSRIMMMQGAEVILHPTNSMKTPTDDAAKITRATENKFYFVSANVAGPIGFSVDRSEPGGRSRILDFRGNVLAYDGSASESTISAMIDIEKLRSNRLEDVGPSEILRARWEMYRPFFAAATAFPPDSFLETPMKNVGETAAGLDLSRSRFVNITL